MATFIEIQAELNRLIIQLATYDDYTSALNEVKEARRRFWYVQEEARREEARKARQEERRRIQNAELEAERIGNMARRRSP